LFLPASLPTLDGLELFKLLDPVLQSGPDYEHALSAVVP
jgi:hypothetical protein